MALLMVNKVDEVGIQAMWKSAYLSLTYAIIKLMPRAGEGPWLLLS